MYIHKELVEKIKEAILEKHPELENQKGIDDVALIEEITFELEGLWTDYTFNSIESNCEYWVECRYFSKIQKTIIFDYDVNACFDDIDDLVEILADYQEWITEFENTITIK